MAFTEEYILMENKIRKMQYVSNTDPIRSAEREIPSMG